MYKVAHNRSTEVDVNYVKNRKKITGLTVLYTKISYIYNPIRLHEVHECVSS